MSARGLPVGACSDNNHRHVTVDEVLSTPGLSPDVARSMLAAVALGKTRDVSPRLWMRLLNTYLDMVDPQQSDEGES